MIALAIALALNPAVTQAAIHQTICVRGWTRTIRPPAAYTHALKRQLVPRGQHLGDYVLDHKMPLELGGAPYDRANLQLQAKADSYDKDQDERYLNRAVCRGEMSLRQAQTLMAHDWP